MYRISAVIAVAGIALAILGMLTSTGWMVLSGMAILVFSVVMGALTRSSGTTAMRPGGR
jgi:hypothetical protein